MKQLTDEILAFNEVRGWTAGNRDARSLAISISLEAAELLEHFQWQSGEEAVSQNRTAVEDEAADVFIYLLQLADVLGIDLEEAARRKIEKNALKYPAPGQESVR
ncbi:nucleotide pyrophosphohydrolase [Edaphobacillus lindanitolerans]|uniref:NTP pyrophosphatase, house-cleaning of non-canonical NTPs n=1 Tax=Edaphobacillus lindanitolerans TaxID=550447 RepID=A0A1U7PM36_9BACI|nr:nucleotide pyrophosphohydrolase [Edaphobacillus lindanitolerans]SIT89159.1 NTP pyrophosphatase, house-cleaning of non-canonical NTPs [Edaphobacillus lindanitolerans]